MVTKNSLDRFGDVSSMTTPHHFYARKGGGEGMQIRLGKVEPSRCSFRKVLMFGCCSAVDKTNKCLGWNSSRAALTFRNSLQEWTNNTDRQVCCQYGNSMRVKYLYSVTIFQTEYQISILLVWKKYESEIFIYCFNIPDRVSNQYIVSMEKI